MKTFKQLFAKGTIIHYKKRDIIFSPTQLPEGVYQVQKGFLYSYTMSNQGKRKIQNIVKPGEIFPLLINLTKTSSRFYVEAMTDIKLSLLEKEEFFSQIYADSNLTQAFIQSLANYLNVYVERVENLEMDSIQKRVVGRLLQFASRFGIQKDNKTIFVQVPMTREIIGQSINISRENVSRELNKLQDKNLIAFQGKHLIILNKEELSRLL